MIAGNIWQLFNENTQAASQRDLAERILVTPSLFGLTPSAANIFTHRNTPVFPRLPPYNSQIRRYLLSFWVTFVYLIISIFFRLYFHTC